MTSSTYAKYSDHTDRWVVWDKETGHETLYTRNSFADTFGLTRKQEQYARFGESASRTDEQLVELYETPTWSLNTATGKIEAEYQKVVNSDYLTNPALYIPGESGDVEHNRFYGRPLPEGVSVPRPA